MADKKYIRIPAPIQLVDTVSKRPVKEPLTDDEGHMIAADGARITNEAQIEWVPRKRVTFSEFVIRGMLDTDPRWVKTSAAIRASVKIQEALDRAEETGIFELVKDDWEKLRDNAREPRHAEGNAEVEGFGFFAGRDARFVRQLHVFAEAIIDGAKDRIDELPPAPAVDAATSNGESARA